mmetsp:Transcript_13988/g.29306  ORF Transcript_13988/g.29306 Transcript_13988/m.29306 type:complete len:230 (+) Transcript_13988:80-769(+)|eukprot:CAMPEP_0201123748 /NCGR_PEP_ID=MMETSP0850-20130426/9066_1 /ASSEMBLY_ACC=CAM_ASM_000622 /TAXON_ID=183588 /ORGANISM="Pseudo-nitzschia fraudulenta, Strain WWA7" /LENGTH=229 /DNA_ID=CAMNT_0047390817 /DNA_START=83 /DNA_END=772 /DNA_ORIENTATION=-
MMFKSFAAVAALLCVSGASAFAPSPVSKTPMTSLQMAGNNEDSTRKVAASVLAATFILGNVAAVAPAQAMDDSYFGSSTVVAARSGGRAGGRSSAARARPSPSSSSSRSSSTTVINRTYVTPAAPVYSSPSVIVAPPVYNPMPGLGLSLGLNAVGQIGNDMRDYRQEREIQDTRSELNASRVREAEMEARLRSLESGQGQANQQMQMQMQQQMFMQQQAAANAAAAAAK